MTHDEYEDAMNQAAKRGLLLFLLGIVTLGVGPCVYWWLKERSEA